MVRLEHAAHHSLNQIQVAGTMDLFAERRKPSCGDHRLFLCFICSKPVLVANIRVYGRAIFCVFGGRVEQVSVVTPWARDTAFLKYRFSPYLFSSSPWSVG